MKPTLSIVIPAFNEASRLPRTFQLIHDALGGVFGDTRGTPVRIIEILVVDDGSTDSTSRLTLQAQTRIPELRCFTLPQNVGKGGAIHAGALAATGEWVLVADADSATPWQEFLKLWEHHNHNDVIIGSRASKSSDIRVRQSFVREHMGKTFNLLVRFITGLRFRDTQCGFKLFHRAPCLQFWPQLKIKRFAWDVEFLMLAQKQGLRLCDVPIAWEHQEESKVHPIRDASEMLAQILRLRLRIDFPFWQITAFLLWGLLAATALKLPTFDLDESLYLRASIEAKLSGSYLKPSWDGVPLNHKPPFFYGLILWASQILNESPQTISAFAARLPNFFATLGLFLVLGWRGIFGFLSVPFLVATSLAVIFDPIQTLFLLIAARVWIQARATWVSASVFGGLVACATLFKGLNGFIIPALGFGFAVLVEWAKRKRIPTSKIAWGVLAGLVAASLSALGFLGLHHAMGSGFTEEFFWVHHFSRAAEPMEGHGGSPLLPLIFFILGLGPLWFSVRTRILAQVELLSLIAATLVLFTLTRTLLPHYLWPAWVFMILAVAKSSAPPRAATDKPVLSPYPLAWRGFIFFVAAPLVIAGLVFPWISIHQLGNLLHDLFHNERGTTLLQGVTALPPGGRLFSVALGLTLLFLFFQRKKSPLTLPQIATINLLSLNALIGTLLPLALQVYVYPIQHMARQARDHLYPGACLQFSGPYSPSFSLALGNGIAHNKCQGNHTHLIVPTWKLKECDELGAEKISSAGWLHLCVKPQKIKPQDQGSR